LTHLDIIFILQYWGELIIEIARSFLSLRYQINLGNSSFIFISPYVRSSYPTTNKPQFLEDNVSIHGYDKSKGV